MSGPVTMHATWEFARDAAYDADAEASEWARVIADAVVRGDGPDAYAVERYAAAVQSYAQLAADAEAAWNAYYATTMHRGSGRAGA